MQPAIIRGGRNNSCKSVVKRHKLLTCSLGPERFSSERGAAAGLVSGGNISSNLARSPSRKAARARDLAVWRAALLLPTQLGVGGLTRSNAADEWARLEMPVEAACLLVSGGRLPRRT